MRLRRIALTDVRGVRNSEVHFAPEGVTVVQAPNEAGKTTLLDALDVLLEVKDSSNAGRVKDLQPADRDVPSTIEVELTCGPYHLTCTKTYNKQRATVLRIHAPTPAQLRGTEAHDRLREILASEVDLALYAALRLGQGRDGDALALGGSVALAARLDAAAGGSGLGEDGGLLDRAEREVRRWYTPGGRPTAALSGPQREVVEARDELASVAARLAALEQDVDELTEADREYPRLEARLAQLGPAIEAARQAAGQVDRARAQVETRRAELGRHDAELARCAAALEERRRHGEELAELDQALRAAEDELGPLRAEHRALEAEQQRSDACLDELAAALAARRVQADEARAALELRRAVDEQDALTGRLAQIEQLRAQAREAEQALAGIRLDDAALRRIRRADEALRVARATRSAGAPTVQVRAHQPVTIDLDGQPVQLAAGEGHTAAITERFGVSLEAVLDLEVRAGRSAAELARTVRDAEVALSEQCRAAGVADAEDAERVAAARGTHEAVLARRDEELARLLEGRSVDELHDAARAAADRVAALRRQLPGLEPADPTSAQSADEQAQAALRQAEHAHAEHRAAHDARGAELQRRDTAVAVAVSRHEQRAAQREQVAARLAEARDRHADAALQAALSEAEAALATATSELAAAEAALRELDPESVRLEHDNLVAQRDDAQARLRALDQERATLRERLRLAGEQGLGEAKAHAEDRLARAQLDARRVEARAGAARLLHDTLSVARDEATRAYREPLRARIAAKARLLLGGDVDVVLDDDLAVQARVRDGVALRLDQLSAGAREQLAVLTGLAAAELAGGDGVPFVLDDALGFTDPDRLARLGALLGQVRDAQVVVLTCVAERFEHVGGAAVVRLRESRP